MHFEFSNRNEAILKKYTKKIHLSTVRSVPMEHIVPGDARYYVSNFMSEHKLIA